MHKRRRSVQNKLQDVDHGNLSQEPMLPSQKHCFHWRQGSSQSLGVDSYYTRIEILQQISMVVEPFLSSYDFTFVDFACGRNDFAPLLPCKTVSFDISPPRSSRGAIVKDWFHVQRSDIPGESLAIGLNPPFGYQGSSAKKFVQHAISFRPIYMFLILPNIRWTPDGYESIHQQQLPNDAFYDPQSGKTLREICTTFNIFKLSEGGGQVETTTIKSEKAAKPAALAASVPGVEITRRWAPSKYPFIVLRRVGRNTTKQFYCVTDKDHCSYYEKGRVYPGLTWRETGNNHAVESEYFLKLYFTEKKSIQELLVLCDNIYRNPEDGYDRKQPHAITNTYIKRMVQAWLASTGE